MSLHSVWTQSCLLHSCIIMEQGQTCETADRRLLCKSRRQRLQDLRIGLYVCVSLPFPSQKTNTVHCIGCLCCVCVVRDWFLSFLSAFRCWWIWEKHNSQTDENTTCKWLQCRVSVTLQHMSVYHTSVAHKPDYSNQYSWIIIIYILRDTLKKTVLSSKMTEVETNNSEQNHELFKMCSFITRSLVMFQWTHWTFIYLIIHVFLHNCSFIQ